MALIKFLRKKKLPVDHLKCNKPVIDDCGEVSRLVRELPPQHCILRVDPFSLLKTVISSSGTSHFDSPEFIAGGHKWVLRIYPNGNTEEQSRKHLSFYVELVDKITSDIVITASLRFFILDQIRDHYHTVLGLRDKRFHAVHSVCGVSKVLSLDSFTDSSNGFLLNDGCVFGAEVLVLNSPTKASTLSRIHIKSDRSYTWKIKNFSKLEARRTISPSFKVEGRSWNLHLHPRGDCEEKGKSLSLYLHLDDESLSRGNKVYIRYYFYAKDQILGTLYKKTVCTWFEKGQDSKGFRAFLPLKDLKDQEKGFLKDDTMIIEVRIDEIFMMECVEDPADEKPRIQDEWLKSSQ